jgi:hypothetical protein
MPAKPSAPRPSTPAAGEKSRNGASANGRQIPTASGSAKGGKDGEPKILFQKYFKSVGPRTYAAQVKECANGNHFLVLTEGKRDPETGEVRKTRVFVYSEDFATYFRMLHETAQFIKSHPVPEAIKMKRMRYWARKEAEAATAAREAAAAAAAKPITPTKVIKPVAKPASRRPGRGR